MNSSFRSFVAASFAPSRLRGRRLFSQERNGDREAAKSRRWPRREFIGPFITAVFLLLLCLAAGPPTTRTAKIRIVLAGDSTVTDKAGWGPGFERLLTPDVECLNLSRGGRSSKSFIDEGAWKQCLDAKPDYILIQFGHNDQPGKPGRSTDLATEYPKYMTQYVDDARAIGARPILVTSMSRRQFRDDGKIHSTLTPWVDVVKKIAAEKNVPLIDLHARTIDLYEKLGKDGCEKQIAPRKDDGTIDNTHLNAKGGVLVGAIVIEELRKAVPELATFTKSPSSSQPAE